MKFMLSIGLFAAYCMLYGCVSSPTMNTMQREAYLQQFIGQSSDQIRTQLDLNSIGYQHVSPPILRANSLTYIAARSISIPVPMAQNPAMGIGAGTSVPIPSTAAQNYDVNLNCRISFVLERNIAKAVHMSGRTC